MHAHRLSLFLAYRINHAPTQTLVILLEIITVRGINIPATVSQSPTFHPSCILPLFPCHPCLATGKGKGAKTPSSMINLWSTGSWWTSIHAHLFPQSFSGHRISEGAFLLPQTSPVWSSLVFYTFSSLLTATMQTSGAQPPACGPNPAHGVCHPALIASHRSQYFQILWARWHGSCWHMGLG